jgi:hypothetical protein
MSKSDQTVKNDSAVNRPPFGVFWGAEGRQEVNLRSRGRVMKYYFFGLGTLVAVCVGCAIDGQQCVPKGEYHAPPAAMMQHPGPMVDGPGPGVMPMMAQPPARSFQSQTTQLRFVRPEGMTVGWKAGDSYAENQLIAPGRYNFVQGNTFRLKLTDIPGVGREGLTLYPTLQVYPSHPTTDAYLSHNSIPMELTDEDLDQVATNNFVTKVIYLPDPKFQELAIANVETLVSTRLDPGVDPVAEADRRGTVMVVLRMGNMDLEMPGAAGPATAHMAAPHGQLQQVGYAADAGQVAPTPVDSLDGSFHGVPAPMIMGVAGGAGQPGFNPVSGVAGTPLWGQPHTATPIGLPGPPHLPLGGPASLKSHTVRNRTKTDLPKPVDHFLVDVKHDPGVSMPAPVKHVEYTETHPEYKPGEVAYPAWSMGQ